MYDKEVMNLQYHATNDVTISYKQSQSNDISERFFFSKKGNAFIGHITDKYVLVGTGHENLSESRIKGFVFSKSHEHQGYFTIEKDSSARLKVWSEKQPQYLVLKITKKHLNNVSSILVTNKSGFDVFGGKCEQGQQPLSMLKTNETISIDASDLLNFDIPFFKNDTTYTLSE